MRTADPVRALLLLGLAGVAPWIGAAEPTPAATPPAATPPAATPPAATAAPVLTGADWESWAPGNDVRNLASLQRGARNFLGYCVGCHSLKYMRYARMAADLHIPADQLAADLLIPGDKPTDYIISPMPPADAVTWFGKAPPDLSLEARLRGTSWIYQYLKTFYADPSRTTTGVNNLRLENSAMPHALGNLEGIKFGVFRTIEDKGSDGQVSSRREFAGFQPGYVAGSLTASEYDDFVRDLVNFLDYVGEPAQVARRQLGIWVILFLLAFTVVAWLLKREYWNDVR
jgi:ubiquinol-cytochrome c reductase cytochrome c1 subunit